MAFTVPRPARRRSDDEPPCFAPGDRVCSLDRKERHYLAALQAGRRVPHARRRRAARRDHRPARGRRCCARRTGGTYIVFRPTLADFVIEMPRGAQVIYPKDLGPMLMLADIYPGARVLESGVGSRRAVDDAAARRRDRSPLRAARRFRRPRAAQRRATSSASEASSATRSSCATATTASTTTDLDRVVLDLPEPWQVVPHAAQALRAGGILVAYTPSIVQASQLREALAEHGFDVGRDARGAQPHLARRRRRRAPRPPHGRPHRLPDPRPPAVTVPGA